MCAGHKDTRRIKQECSITQHHAASCSTVPRADLAAITPLHSHLCGTLRPRPCQWPLDPKVEWRWRRKKHVAKNLACCTKSRGSSHELMPDGVLRKRLMPKLDFGEALADLQNSKMREQPGMNSLGALIAKPSTWACAFLSSPPPFLAPRIPRITGGRSCNDCWQAFRNGLLNRAQRRQNLLILS